MKAGVLIAVIVLLGLFDPETAVAQISREQALGAIYPGAEVRA